MGCGLRREAWRLREGGGEQDKRRLKRTNDSEVGLYKGQIQEDYSFGCGLLIPIRCPLLLTQLGSNRRLFSAAFDRWLAQQAGRLYCYKLVPLLTEKRHIWCFSLFPFVLLFSSVFDLVSRPIDVVGTRGRIPGVHFKPRLHSVRFTKLQRSAHPRCQSSAPERMRSPRFRLQPISRTLRIASSGSRSHRPSPIETAAPLLGRLWIPVDHRAFVSCSAVVCSFY